MQWIEDRIERIPISGCWIWTGHIHHSGYGLYQKKSAHRQVYVAMTGTNIDGKVLCHHCDVKACVNPEHLFVGTQKDNIRDMDKKGRRGTVPGELNGRSKLTLVEVQSIKQDTRRYKEISDEYKISQQQVSNIKVGYSWSHV